METEKTLNNTPTFSSGKVVSSAWCSIEKTGYVPILRTRIVGQTFSVSPSQVNAREQDTAIVRPVEINPDK